MSVYLVKPRDFDDDEGTLIRALDKDAAESLFMNEARNDRLGYSAKEAFRITNLSVFEMPAKIGARRVIGEFDAADFDLVQSEVASDLEKTSGTVLCSVSVEDASRGLLEYYIEAVEASDAIEVLKAHEDIQAMLDRGDIKEIRAMEIPGGHGKPGVLDWQQAVVVGFDEDTPRP